MATLGDMIVRVGADTEQFVAGMAGVNRTLDALDGQLQKSTSGWNALAGALTSVGGILTATVTVPLAGLGTAAITSAGQLEQVTIALTNLLGNQEAAQALIRDLQQLAARTPFQFEELVQATRLLLAYGFAAKDIIPIMTAVGDAAAALGAGSEGIDRIIRALGQMQAKGKVAAQEMQQLAELGIPSWQMLADAVGVSVSEVQRMVEQRLIPSAQAVPALLDAMRERFGGMMSQQSLTLMGRWSTLLDELKLALMELGAELLPAAKKIVEFGISAAGALKDVAHWFGQLPEPVKTAILAIGGIVAIAGPVLVALGGLASAATAIATAWPLITTAAGAVAGALGAIISPAGLVIAALAALAFWVAANWEPVKAVLLQAWEGLSEYWTWRWETVRDGVLGIWNAVRSAAETIIRPVAQWISTLWDAIEPAWRAAWDPIAGWLASLWDGIKSAAGSVWDSIKNAAVSAWDAVIGAISRFAEWAAKIPGIAKLMNLGEAWDNAKKLAEAQQAAADSARNMSQAAQQAGASTGAMARAAVDAAKAHGDLEKTIAQQRKELIESRDAALKQDITWRAIAKSVELANDAYFKARRTLVELKANLLAGRDATWAIDEANKSWDKTLDRINDQLSTHDARIRQLATMTIPPLLSSAQAMADSARRVADAWKTLGLPEPGEVERRKGDLVRAYEAIRDSGLFSADEVRKAYSRMTDELGKMPGTLQSAWRTLGLPSPEERQQRIDELRKAYEAIRDSGSASASDIQRAYEAMQKAVSREVGDTLGGNVKRAFEEVSTAISQSVQKMVGILIGTESGSLMDALRELGRGILSHLVEPWIDAFADLIERGVRKLISWLLTETGLMGALRTVGSAIGSIFGAGASAAAGAAGSAAAGAAGAAGAGAAGAAGTTAGAAGAAAAAGTIGASVIGGLVSGGIAAVGSLVGAAMIKGDLGDIEVNTRYTAIALIGSLGVIDLLWKQLDHWWYARGLWEGANERLGWIWEKVDSGLSVIADRMRESIDRINDVRYAVEQERVISVQIDGREVARAMLTYLQSAGVEA